MKLTKIENYIAKTLNLSIPDIAINGVQISNSGEVHRIVTAVDFSEELLDKIIPLKVSAIIVHHGIFWGKLFPLTGRYHRIVKKLFQHDIALLAYHLPLDIHATLGNNILLLHALGCKFVDSFGDYKGVKVLFSGIRKPISFSQLVNIFTKKIGNPLAVVETNQLKGKNIKTIGVCTGGGIFGIEEAKRKGCEVFITGDAAHTAHHLSKELGIHLISGGHYNTEVLGVKTLGEKIAKDLKLPVDFLDLPTHL